MATENKDTLVDTIQAHDDARVVVVKELFGNIYTAPVDTLALRNRSAVLRRVRADWITGLLHQSLANVARLELNLTPDHAAVSSGLSGVIQTFNSAPIPIAPGTPISRIFDRYEQSLLILGGPGTGKTTLLLELAETLLDRAEADAAHPVPIVFNLSSWALAHLPLAQWFVAEMNQRNDIPRALATEWIARDNIIPLLDGLDEVDPAHRAACLEAINTYRSDHGLVPIAVCSRTDDYNELHAKLRLRAAVLVEPLTPDDVRDALASVSDLAELSLSARQDPVLAEMLRTPLMLWIAAMAYRGATAEVAVGHTSEDTRTRLFSAYVQAMFARKRTSTRYSDSTLLRWLTLLAGAMTAKRLTIFSLEILTPAFDPRPHRKWLCYPFTAFVTIVFCSACCLVISAAGYGFSGILINVLSSLHVLSRGPVSWSEQQGYAEFVAFMSAVVSAPICVTVSLFTRLTPAESIDISFRNIGKRIPSALGTIAILLVLLTISWGFVDADFAFSASRLIDAIKEIYKGDAWKSISFPPYQAFLCGLFRLFVTERPLLRSRTNQGTRRSMLAAFCVTAVTLSIGLTVALNDGLIEWVILSPLLAGLCGGFFALRNYTLRFYLWATRFGPLRYTAFLDEATHRIFLTRVGGGYVFKHRMLQEYLATLPTR